MTIRSKNSHRAITTVSEEFILTFGTPKCVVRLLSSAKNDVHMWGEGANAKGGQQGDADKLGGSRRGLAIWAVKP